MLLYYFVKYLTPFWTNDKRILTKDLIACRAVIDNWITPFAAYTAAETPNAFQWVGQPQKLPILVGGSRPHLIHGSLDLLESVPQTTSRSVQPFLRITSVWPTHRHTDHATCDICRNRPHLCCMHAIRHNNSGQWSFWRHPERQEPINLSTVTINGTYQRRGLWTRSRSTHVRPVAGRHARPDTES